MMYKMTTLAFMLLANLHVIGAMPAGEPSLASLEQKLDRLSEQFDDLGKVDEQVRDGISSIVLLVCGQSVPIVCCSPDNHANLGHVSHCPGPAG